MSNTGLRLNYFFSQQRNNFLLNFLAFRTDVALPHSRYAMKRADAIKKQRTHVLWMERLENNKQNIFGQTRLKKNWITCDEFAVAQPQRVSIKQSLYVSWINQRNCKDFAFFFLNNMHTFHSKISVFSFFIINLSSLIFMRFYLERSKDFNSCFSSIPFVGERFMLYFHSYSLLWIAT